jgi:flagellar biosynthesis chaperone FliJ
MLSSILGIMDQASLTSLGSSTDKEAGSDDAIAKLEFILSDLRNTQIKEMRSEVDDLKRELSKANIRITALETVRESQDKERQALCNALTQAMGSG